MVSVVYAHFHYAKRRNQAHYAGCCYSECLHADCCGADETARRRKVMAPLQLLQPYLDEIYSETDAKD
jgi:hypothetical protein